MIPGFDRVKAELKTKPGTWLVPGVAGFIGSHLLETLLRLDQSVVGLDNFSNGRESNLEQVRLQVSPTQWKCFQMVTGDITNPADCKQVSSGVDWVLHQAALGSVPRSVADPHAIHEANITGFLNILMAARDAKARRFVYASSSSVYGDEPRLPNLEDRAGKPLSPYAASKAADELYAAAFASSYNMQCVGLRYFNVFGPRQNPDGAYAAVIPKWIMALASAQQAVINGDGDTSRDFCFVANIVQANILAAVSPDPSTANQVYNVAAGRRTNLLELFELIKSALADHHIDVSDSRPVHQEQRPGDVRHSLADITKIRQLLGYEPSHNLEQGLQLTVRQYLSEVGRLKDPECEDR